LIKIFLNHYVVNKSINYIKLVIKTFPFQHQTRLFSLQVALKRQQAAEDAIALGLTAVATGTQYGYLPPGPIFGMAITGPKSQEQGKNS
jgi:hypothetical protein